MAATKTKVESGRQLWRLPRIIDGHLILDEKEVVAVYEVSSTLNPITADTKALEQANRRYQQALDTLKPGEKVQIVVDCSRYEPKADIEKMQDRTVDEAAPGFKSYYPHVLEAWFKGYCTVNMVPVFRYFVLFTYKPGAAFGASSEPSLKSTLNEVSRRAGEFMRFLASNDLKCVQLSQSAIVEMLDRSVNPSRLTPLAAAALNRASLGGGMEPDAAELLFRSTVLNNVPKSDRRFSFIQVGRRYIKSMAFTQAPLADNVLSTIMPELMMSQREFRFSFYVEGLKQENAVRQLQHRRGQALGAVTFGGGRNTQEAEEQAAAVDSEIRSHSRKEVKYLKWSGYLSVFADEESELHAIGNDLAGSCTSLTPEEGIFAQVQYWQSALPMCTDKASRDLMAQSAAIASIYPFFEFRSSSPEGGVLLGFSPANQPIFFDPWSKYAQNPNVFITGQAGGGKSYLINLILNRLGPMALDVSIIDKAKSYRSSCLAAGGDYVEFDLEGKNSVNVWDCDPYDARFENTDLNDMAADGEVTANKIADVAALAEIILAEPGHPLPTLEMSVLTEDIKDTYDRVLGQSRNAVNSSTVPTFSDLFETLTTKLDQKTKDAKSDFTEIRKVMRQKLAQAVDGTLANLVNKRTTLKTGGRFRVFDISNLPSNDQILGAANYILASWLYRHWKRNKLRNVRQIGVVDEMAMFMRHRAGRELLANLARRSRHMGLVPFFATQELEDVLDYDETKAILNNCKTMFLFSQARNVIDNITSLLSLTDQERSHLENLKLVKGVYSNCFNIYGERRNVLTVRPDPVTRWLNTTEPTYDVPRVNRAMEETGGAIWPAVEKLIATERN